MIISLPDDIILVHVNYNSRTPWEYFNDLSKRLSKFNIKFNGFIIEEKWLGNNTLTSITHDNITYNNYRINKLYRYLRNIESKKFKKPSFNKLTPEILIQNVENECIKRGGTLEFLGFDEYNKTKTYLKLKCNDNTKHSEAYEWNTTTYDSFFSNNIGCLKCSGTHKYSINELNENLKIKSKETGIKFELIDEKNFNGVFSKVILTCKCNYTWSMTYDNFMRDKGCPLCNSVSYKNGYKSSDFSSGIYILEVSDDYNNIVGYKFGITKNIKHRMGSYKNKCKYKLNVVYHKVYENCNDAFNIEKEIKRTIKARHLTKELFGDGWTETVSPTSLNEIMTIIKKGS